MSRDIYQCSGCEKRCTVMFIGIATPIKCILYDRVAKWREL